MFINNDANIWYNNHIGYLFSESIYQYKKYWPNFYLIIFIVIKSVKYGTPFLFIVVLVKRKILVKFILMFVVFFVILEMGLRTLKFEPGKLYANKWFHKVDKLEVLKAFNTDKNGIYKLDTTYIDLLNRTVNLNPKIVEDNIDSLVKNNFSQDFVSVIRDFNAMLFTEKPKSNFELQIERIKNQSAHNKKDSIILFYAKHPFNNEGFFSIPFVHIENDKPSVLVLGDSFTWGHDASNKTYSFVNELIAKGYVVYNTGISGVDVTQYEIIAKKYIPIIQPDIVILNFFIGNDVSYVKRVVDKENYPIFFSTNAGNIMSIQESYQFLTAKDAYKNILNKTYLIPQNNIQKIISKSSVLTQFWKVKNKVIPKTTINKKSYISLAVLEKPACNEEINNIKELCKQYHSKFELLVIPDFVSNNDVADFPYLFENIEYVKSPVGKENYNLSNGHFNKEGHYEYALFLDSLITHDFK